MPATLTSRLWHRRMGRIVALLLATLPGGALAIQATAPKPAVDSSSNVDFDVNRDRETLVSLDGPWRFHPGDSPDQIKSANSDGKAWADPAFDDSAWSRLKSDQPWSDQGFPAMSGFAWYRFTVRLPAGDRQMSLLFAPIETGYEVYVDGHLAGTAGKMPPSIAPFAMFEFHQFPIAPTGSQSSNSGQRIVHVAVRVWHSKIWAGYLGGGPSRGGNMAGATSLIEAQFVQRKNAQRFIFVDYYVYAITATIVGLTILGLFFFRPNEYEYLWCAILLLSLAIDAAFQIAYNLYSFLPVPVFDLLDGLLIAANISAALAFFSIVLQARRDSVWKITLTLALVSPFAVILYWPGWLSVAVSAALQLLCLLPSSIWVLTILFRRALRREVDALLLLVPTGLYIGYGFVYNIAILLSQAGVMPIPDILLEPLPLPPFTIHWMILFDLILLAALLAFLIRRFTMARQGEERYSGQMEAARQIQKLLLPEAIPQVKGFTIDCIYRPADVVGGDFFQILPTLDGGLLIVVGDVAGKGLPAAMMVSMIIGAIRAEAANNSDPATLAASLNQRLIGQMRNENGKDAGSGFTTCLCAHLAANGSLAMANAGHLPPYRNGEEMPLPGALPLGMLGGLAYETATFQLAPGDRLTFVSDGVVEAQNKAGELWGFDRTQALSTESASKITETASSFGQVDDITVVVIAFHGLSDAIPSGPDATDLASPALAV